MVWPVSNFVQWLPTTRNDIQQGVQTDAILTCNIQQRASICTGLYVNYTLRETIMGCFHTDVISYNRNYKDNGYQLLAQRFLGSFGGQALFMIG